MSVKGYRFVSPGIFLREIDASVLEPTRPERGPVVVGRFKQGPGNRPVVVQNYQDFVQTFGAPHPGGAASDEWRGDAHGGPTYGAYAVEGFLNAGVAPATVMRVMGTQDPSATTAGKAGWDAKNSSGTSVYHVSPGAAGGSTNISALGTNGGAYGLFIFPTGSTATGGGPADDYAAAPAANKQHPTGTLAAVFYLSEGMVELSGTLPDGAHAIGIGGTAGEAVTGSAVMLRSLSGSGTTYNAHTFGLQFRNAAGAVVKNSIVDFTLGSEYYIRRQLSTGPTRTNGTISATEDRLTYWLGESFEQNLEQVVSCVSGSEGEQLGVILGLGNANAEWQEHREGYANAKTGWFIHQDDGDASNFNVLAIQKLFRFHALDHGEWVQNNLRLSIENIQKSPSKIYRYGKFDVVLRNLAATKDGDNAVELYSECSLDPQSERYVAKLIGDKYVEWDADNLQMREYGTYDNQSKYVRIELSDTVKEGTLSPELVPFGFYGPPRFSGFSFKSGSANFHPFADTAGSAFANAFVEASGSIPSIQAMGRDVREPMGTGRDAIGPLTKGQTAADDYAYHVSARFPELKLVKTCSVGSLGGATYHTHFGVDWSRQSSVGSGGTPSESPMFQLDHSVKDVVRRMPAYYATGSADGTDSAVEDSWVFTLDDIILEEGASKDTTDGMSGVALPFPLAYYVSGSRRNTLDEGSAWSSSTHRSWTAASGAFNDSNEGLCDFGFNKMTTLFYGGHDGFDLTESEPLRNTYLDDAAGERTTNYGYNSVMRSLEILSDPEYVEYNVLAVPGLTETNLTDKMLSVCEDRADALAIIDVPGGFVPRGESNGTDSARRGSINSIVSNLKGRELDSSYGCAYYPWVQIADTRTKQRLYVPPSVIALGVFASSQAASDVWFAPAGFVRGGLGSQGMDPGAAGLKVLNVKDRIVSSDRDLLYEHSVNPIAKFPSEGIVVFGQKTLQALPSALDRINVRRLLLHVKKEISIISSQTLFQPNVKATWLSFSGRANRFLASVQARFGLTDYLVQLDETTTTDDLIDRNILYARIFLKPARAIEFIAIDFVITRSGASFTD